jgi:uncharacterized membrane protein YfbV (UPF0208 family)
VSTAPSPHPVRLVVTDDLHRSRLTVFFRLLLAIPHFFWLGLFSIGAFFIAIINWFATLFTGKSPKGLHDFLAGYVRYATQFFAYLYLAANPYPPFYLGSEQNAYVIDVQIDPPERQNRWVTGFRFFLAFPAFIVSGALSGGGSVSSGGRGFSTGGAMGLMSILNWFSSLIRGRSPRGLRDFSAWALAYTAQVYAYLFLLTDKYPNSDPLIFLREAQLEPPDPEGRPQIANTDDLRRSRLTVFFRLPLAFPHIFWLLLWSVAAYLAAIANWFFTLIMGRPAKPLARFLSAFIRYSAHVGAFFWVIGNPFPGFVGAPGSYPVDVHVETKERQNRWITGFKFVLVFPAFLVNSALGWVLVIGSVMIWFYALVLGRAPSGLQETGAYAIGYGAQLNAYLFNLTDRYPHSSPLAVVAQAPPAAPAAPSAPVAPAEPV